MLVAQLSLENLLHSINILNALNMNRLWLITVRYNCVEPTLHPKYFWAFWLTKPLYIPAIGICYKLGNPKSDCTKISQT